VHWKRKLGSRLSSETDVILRPSSKKKAMDDSFIYISKFQLLTANKLITDSKIKAENLYGKGQGLTSGNNTTNYFR